MQNRGIMNALDYSLEYLRQVRQSLMNLEGKSKETAWAVGGILTTLVSNLLYTFTEVTENSFQRCQEHEEAISAKDDLLEIRSKFNALIDKMLDSE